MSTPRSKKTKAASSFFPNSLTTSSLPPSTPPLHPNQQGRVRTKTVKKASRQIIEKYYARLTLDFATNQRVCEEVAVIQSKRLRNKIAGFTTHLMKRIQRGPVRGISLKLQEEERERRMDFVPEVSAVDATSIELDADSMEMLKAVGLGALPGVKAAPAPGGGGGGGAGGAAVPGYSGPGDRERRRERRAAA